MTRRTIGQDTDADKRVALEVLAIAARHEKQNKPVPGYQAIIIGLNKASVANEQPSGIFMASSDSHSGYVGSILTALMAKGLLEKHNAPSLSHLNEIKYVYALTGEGRATLSNPDSLVMPSRKQGHRAGIGNESAAHGR